MPLHSGFQGPRECFLLSGAYKLWRIRYGVSSAHIRAPYSSRLCFGDGDSSASWEAQDIAGMTEKMQPLCIVCIHTQQAGYHLQGLM
jgi:hypothetical protein